MAAALAALASGAAPAGAAPAGRQPAAEDLVKLRLVADRSAIAAGAALTVAARFDIAPGWHIYWVNPGEAGLATEAAFSAPAGFDVGPVRYPGPVRFQTPGETAASYGYSGAAILSSAVKAPAGLAGARNPARFSVQATWLVCRDVCLRGQGGASLDLPIATRALPARPANAELFARHRSELPRRFAELHAARRWERDAAGAALLVTVPRADKVEYFPPSGEDFQLASQGAAPARDGATLLRLVYKPGFAPARARGVLAVTSGAEKRYYALDLEEAP